MRRPVETRRPGETRHGPKTRGKDHTRPEGRRRRDLSRVPETTGKELVTAAVNFADLVGEYDHITPPAVKEFSRDIMQAKKSPRGGDRPPSRFSFK